MGSDGVARATSAICPLPGHCRCDGDMMCELGGIRRARRLRCETAHGLLRRAQWDDGAEAAQAKAAAMSKTRTKLAIAAQRCDEVRCVRRKRTTPLKNAPQPHAAHGAARWDGADDALEAVRREVAAHARRTFGQEPRRGYDDDVADRAPQRGDGEFAVAPEAAALSGRYRGRSPRKPAEHRRDPGGKPGEAVI
jgi:hypothetical protein